MKAVAVRFGEAASLPRTISDAQGEPGGAAHEPIAAVVAEMLVWATT